MEWFHQVNNSDASTPDDFERTLAWESDGAGFQLFFFWATFGYLLNHSGINSYIHKMGL